jgi:hypothetical protein
VCVWDENSGKITLADGVTLWAQMPRKKLIAGLETFTGKPCRTDDAQRASVLTSASFPFCEGIAACLCAFHMGRLHTVELYPAGGTAAQRRARLFRFIGVQDPCPDTMRGVLSRFALGTAYVATDPRGGGSSLRITYTIRE